MSHGALRPSDLSLLWLQESATSSGSRAGLKLAATEAEVVMRRSPFPQQTATSKPIFLTQTGFEGKLISMRFIRI